MTFGRCADFCVGVGLDASPSPSWRDEPAPAMVRREYAVVAGEVDPWLRSIGNTRSNSRIRLLLIEAVEKVSWSGSSAPTLTLIKSENSRKSPAIGRRENRRTV